MKKFYVSIEKDGSVLLQELEVELISAWEPQGKYPFEIRTEADIPYRILTPGKLQGEVWCGWTFYDTEHEACAQLGKLYLKSLQGNLLKFLKFMDAIVHDTLGERTKWRV